MRRTNEVLKKSKRLKIQLKIENSAKNGKVMEKTSKSRSLK